MGHLVGVGRPADLMLVLLFLYFGYIALAPALATRRAVRAGSPAIFGLVGAVNIPIINRSVVWWN